MAKSALCSFTVPQRLEVRWWPIELAKYTWNPVGHHGYLAFDHLQRNKSLSKSVSIQWQVVPSKPRADISKRLMAVIQEEQVPIDCPPWIHLLSAASLSQCYLALSRSLSLAIFGQCQLSHDCSWRHVCLVASLFWHLFKLSAVFWHPVLGGVSVRKTEVSLSSSLWPGRKSNIFVSCRLWDAVIKRWLPLLYHLGSYFAVWVLTIFEVTPVFSFFVGCPHWPSLLVHDSCWHARYCIQSIGCHHVRLMKDRPLLIHPRYCFCTLI